MNLPLLSLLLALPLAGAALIAALPERAVRPCAALFQIGVLLLASVALFTYDPHGERFQLVERALWLPALPAYYQLGVDGLSVLFLPATALVFLGALVLNWNAVSEDRRLHHALQLLLLAATLGIFCALDLLLFFLFWELSLIPLYFLLARWGTSAGAAQVAARYCLLMLAGGALLLLAFALLAVARPGAGFDLIAQLAQPLPRATQWTVFLLCLVGFGVKVPLVPLHTWLPQLALAAPGSLTAVLLGLKVGAYGLIRMAIPLAPDVAADLHWLLAGLGTLALLYGAVSMLAQTNLRVALAQASICHVGLVLLGLASLSAQGVHGAVSLLLSFTLASGGASLLLESLRQRTGSTDLQALGGAAQTMPLLATGYLVCGLAGVGMPGTSSFPGEFLLILSALEAHTGAGMAALFALSIAAGAFLHLYRKAFFGPVSQAAVAGAEDLRPRERVLLLALIAMIIGIGVHPEPWFDRVRPAAEAWAADLRR